jgi:DNA processing protein
MFAERIAADLGAAGYTVVSGLARGVDAAAHKRRVGDWHGRRARRRFRSSLSAAEPEAARRPLRTRRGRREAPLGTSRGRATFPRRNSIISGVSRGVVIIEAALRSGSLITRAPQPIRARRDGRARLAARSARTRFERAHQTRRDIDRRRGDVIAALGEGAPPLRPLSSGPLFADMDAPPPPPGLPKKIAALLSPTPIHVNDSRGSSRRRLAPSLLR